jgi:flagellar hook-associated protein 2
MASISSLGVGSGLDLGNIVSSLIEAERAPTEQRLDSKEEGLTTELSAFGIFRSSISLFQGASKSLDAAMSGSTKSVTNSDDSVLSTTATSIAAPGDYSVEVSALAQAHAMATSSATAFEDVNDIIGTGDLSISFGTTTSGPYNFVQDTAKATQSITVSAENGNTTLSGLRDYINDNDYGIQASIVNDGNGFRMVLVSEDTGAKNSMQITVSEDSVGSDIDNDGLSQLAYNSLAQNSMTQTVAAEDAALTINGLEITRESNSVVGAINGVTLNLLKADLGNVVKINVSENVNEAKSAINDFVDTYNGLVSGMTTLTKYDAEAGTSGILNGDSIVRSFRSQLSSLLSNRLSGLSGDIRSLVDVGITTKADGTFQINNSTLDSALKNSRLEVESLFSVQGLPSDSEIEYLSATGDTMAGDFSINIAALATQGVYNGTAINSALTISSTNDEFAIKVNSVLSGNIKLSSGTYADEAALATHIEAQINADDAIKAGDGLVSVIYDSVNNRFDISSKKYGEASKIEFTTVDDTTTTDIGFSLGAGTSGVDVIGTINGFAATGNGQTLTSDLGLSKGLSLNINGGLVGSRGSVPFSRGLSSSLGALLTSYLENDGVISTRENGIKNNIEDISEQRGKLDLKIDSLESRLISQFTALDSLIAKFNNTSSFLTQQLASLVEPNSIGKN